MTGLMHHLILRQKNMDEVFARSVFVGWTTLIHLCQRGFVRLCEEAFVPPTGAGTPGDLNGETPELRFEPTLGSNPTVSNVHIVLYSLFNIFR